MFSGGGGTGGGEVGRGGDSSSTMWLKIVRRATGGDCVRVVGRGGGLGKPF